MVISIKKLILIYSNQMTICLNFRDLHKLFIVLLSTIILVTYLLFKFKKNDDDYYTDDYYNNNIDGY